MSAPADAVCSLGPSRKLQALAAIGWGLAELAPRLGMTPRAVSYHRQRVYPLMRSTTAGKIDALYSELSMLPGPSRKARGHAARQGWASPLAWDDGAIDDPTAVPQVDAPRDEAADENVVAAFVQGRPPRWSTLNAADRALLTRELRRREFTVNAVARATRASHSAVANYWKQAA